MQKALATAVLTMLACAGARAESPAVLYEIHAIEIGATEPSDPSSSTMSAKEARQALATVRAAGGKVKRHLATANGVSEAGSASFEVLGDRYEIDEYGSAASGDLPKRRGTVATAKVGKTFYLIGLRDPRGR